ncbi:Riboflavin transporter FmnP [Lachnospiraceae bacterium KH1T2]|nr:Riboflavin transporter FmnP [Lachnospiraceae bacterium KH1T2]
MSSNESTISNNSIKASRFSKVRTMTGVAMLSAVAYVLMFFEFAVPLMPSFIKLDFSELPALIGGFAYGPAAGVAICLIKNIIHLLNTQTGGVGELSNFILGAVFVFISAAIYKKMHSKKGAILGATIGAAAMAAVSLVTNYYIVYPIYTVFMPMDAIIGAYQLILPSVKDLWQCLLVFNVPFTFIKGMCSVIVTVMVYKPLSPILKGDH